MLPNGSSITPSMERTLMNRSNPVTRRHRAPFAHGLRISGLFAAGAFISLSGCEPCGRTGITIFAEAKQTTITAPPAGGAQMFVRVTGSNFNSSVPMTISFRNYPAQNASLVDFQEPASTGAGGALSWTKSIFQLPQRNFSADGAVDVHITAKENNSGCFAATSIKTSSILNPPF